MKLLNWIKRYFKKEKEEEIPYCFHSFGYNTMCDNCRKRFNKTGIYL